MVERYRILSVLLLLTCPCLGTSIVLQDETFDGYANGTDLHGVAGWDNDPAFSAVVTQNQSKIAPQAVDIKLDADLVQEFSGFETGVWSYSEWQYIPSTFTSAGGGQFAGSYFNLLNTYTTGPRTICKRIGPSKCNSIPMTACLRFIMATISIP